MWRASQIAKSALPGPVVDAIRQRKGSRSSAADIDLERLAQIRQASREQLLDVRFLESTLLPQLGVSDEMLFPPRALDGYAGGLRALQWPIQFGPYLRHLSRYNIRSYIELGVRHGGTFVITIEYLRRFGPLDRALGVDTRDSPGVCRYARETAGVSFVRANTHSAEFRELLAAHLPVDLVLIDGDHSEEGCWQDFCLVSDAASVIVFHDIVGQRNPDVGKVWQRVRRTRADEFEFVEFTEQYEEVVARTGGPTAGFGIAARRADCH
jgi:hypothetical protein